MEPYFHQCYEKKGPVSHNNEKLPQNPDLVSKNNEKLCKNIEII